jgi:hypothetical protein
MKTGLGETKVNRDELISLLEDIAQDDSSRIAQLKAIQELLKLKEEEPDVPNEFDEFDKLYDLDKKRKRYHRAPAS